MTEAIEIRKDGQIAITLLNRPEAYNTFDLEAAEQAVNLIRSIAVDDAIRGLVISGKGKAFSAGADLKWAAAFQQGPAAAAHELAGRLHQIVTEIRRMKKPVVAAINGVAAGGGFSLALACDFRVVARSAIMVLAYTSAGLSPDAGGTFMLPRLVGLARSMEIVAFDRPISAEQALTWGLATKVVDDGQELGEAIAMAKELADGSLRSFGCAKQLLTDSFNTSFETHLEREREGIRSCVSHRDGQEGVRAFLEKRKPVFNVH